MACPVRKARSAVRFSPTTPRMPSVPNSLPISKLPRYVQIFQNSARKRRLYSVSWSMGSAAAPPVKYGKQIKGEVFLRIKQNLMALPGQKIEDIREVHSHYMAIAQTRSFFQEYPHIRLIESEDTAKSAADIATKRQMHVGAIASGLAAELFGLEILQESIETHKQNFTRFLILDDKLNVEKRDIDKSSICFTIPHVKGRLSQILSIFSFYDLNLTKIQSLPIPGKEWQYFFYVDLKFEEYNRYREAMNAVQPLMEDVKIMGEYKSYNE